jgi:Flp pilus assembly protein TadD
MQTYEAPSCWYNLALLLVTSPDALDRNGKEAIELTNKLVEIHNDSQCYNLQAMAYAETRDFAAAIASELKALELEPNDPEILSNLKAFQDRKSWIENQFAPVSD